MSFSTLLQTAAASGASPAGTGGSLVSLALTVVAMIAIFYFFLIKFSLNYQHQIYFFLIRPQKKQENETKKMLAALKKGDKIVTIGGIYGTVSSVKENSVVVKVDDNAKIEFTKSAISKVINETTEKAAETKEAKASKKDKNEDSESSKEEK